MSAIKKIVRTVYHELKTPAVIVSLAITIIVSLGGWIFVEDAYTVFEGDAVAYWDMAQVPIDPDNRWTWDGIPDSNVPYTYRILTPFLVHNLFDSSMGGFIFIAIFSLFICNYLIFKIAGIYSPNAFTGSFLVILFSTNFTIINPLLNSALVDLPSYVCTFLIVYIFLKYMIKDKATGVKIWILYAATLVIAALIKEWIFFLLPVLFLYLLYIRKSGKAVKLFFWSLPGVATHLIVRVIMGLFTDIQTISMDLLIERYYTTFGAYRSLFATFGAMWLFLLPALWWAYRHNRIRKELHIPIILAVPVGIFLCTIASDHNRYLFFMCFPFLIPSLTLYFTQYNNNLRKGAFFTIAVVLVLSRLAIFYRSGSWSTIEFQDDTAVIMVTTAATIQVLAALYYIITVHSRKMLPGKI